MATAADWLDNPFGHIVDYFVVEPRAWPQGDETREVHLKAVAVDKGTVDGRSVWSPWQLGVQGFRQRLPVHLGYRR